MVLAVMFFPSGEDNVPASSETTQSLRRAEVESVRLSEIIGVSIELSRKAAGVIRDVKYNKGEETKVKGKTDEGVDEPVTVADAKSNAVMVNGLRTRFPPINILSEETNPDAERITTRASGDDIASLLSENPLLDLSRVLVTVDPLDATKEFTEDLLQYVTTMICITVDGRPIAGIIGRPFAEDEGANPIWGVVPEANGGNGIVQGVDTSSQNANHGTDVVTISRSHTGNAGSIVDSNLTGKTALYAGGSGYKSLLLLEDRAEAYVHVTKIKVWDVCAGEALVRSAGGAFTNTKGEDLFYSRENEVFEKGLIATATPERQRWYQDRLRDVM